MLRAIVKHCFNNGTWLCMTDVVWTNDGDPVCWVRLSDSQGLNEDLEEVAVRFVCDRPLTFWWTERDNVETCYLMVVIVSGLCCQPGVLEIHKSSVSRSGEVSDRIFISFSPNLKWLSSGETGILTAVLMEIQVFVIRRCSGDGHLSS
jgi:hypothetical protein